MLTLGSVILYYFSQATIKDETTPVSELKQLHDPHLPSSSKKDKERLHAHPIALIHKNRSDKEKYPFHEPSGWTGWTDTYDEYMGSLDESEKRAQYGNDYMDVDFEDNAHMQHMKDIKTLLKKEPKLKENIKKTLVKELVKANIKPEQYNELKQEIDTMEVMPEAKRRESNKQPQKPRAKRDTKKQNTQVDIVNETLLAKPKRQR